MPLLFLNLTIETQSSLFAAEATAQKPRTRERLAGSDEDRRGWGTEAWTQRQKNRKPGKGLRFENYLNIKTLDS